jgi:hypothetical protein
MVYRWGEINKSIIKCIVKDVKNTSPRQGYKCCTIVEWIRKPRIFAHDNIEMPNSHFFCVKDIIKLEKIKSEEQLLALLL